MTDPTNLRGRIRTALDDLHRNRERSPELALALGMRPIPNPINLVAAPGSEVTRALDGKVSEFYRVGEASLGGATAGLYLAYLDQWSDRSADREPYRRRVAKVLVERMANDGRWMCILLDHAAQTNAEIILPRRREGAPPGTVRAAVSLKDPTHFHLSLLADLDVGAATSLGQLSRQWNEAFSVENVTKKFHEDFRRLRDRLVLELVHSNPDNPAIAGRIAQLPAGSKNSRASLDAAILKDLPLLACGTRQLGRLLFLWFLQQKRWFGASMGAGSTTFLLDLFAQREGDDAYFNDVLAPIFFDCLGHSGRDSHFKPRHEAVRRFGNIPYLGGGLFRPDAFEEELFGFEGDDRTRRVTIPDGVFDKDKDQQSGQRTVLGFLDSYRFTTQESTPDDQSVDPDPELLGKVFENLYQEDDRHQTGAYYTPREIVHYMCRQALDGYLTEQTGISQDSLNWLRREAIDWTVSGDLLDPTLQEALHHALDNVTILDPAVGSGAFLIGSMQEIVLLRRGLEMSLRTTDFDPGDLDVAEWKRRAITQSLHGVDVNPMAVEICKLRLWLSLVIDQEPSDESEIISLPDLDFRVLAGDSLVDRMGEAPFIQSLPDPRREGFQPRQEILQKVNALQHEIQSLKMKFGGEGITPSEQRTLGKRVRTAELEVARVQLDDALVGARGALAALKKNARATAKAKRDAQAHLDGLERLDEGLREDAPFQKPFLWPVNFHEVMERGGFDVILANPPYVRMEGIDNIDEKGFAFSFKEVAASRADLLVYFYERAVQVLRDGGQLAFITSNKYMRAAYGAGLREFLPRNLQIREVVDFGDLPLFTVAAYPAVVMARKSRTPENEQPVRVADMVYPIRRRLAAQEQSVNHVNVRLALEDIAAELNEAVVPDYPQTLLRKGGWILEDPRLVRLFDRLLTHGTPLGEYAKGRIYYGVKTGLNEAFVIDEAKRTELVEADPRSAELIRPWLRGRDIKRWATDWAGLYVIFSKRGTDIRAYPAIEAHLASFRPALERRATAATHPWWELQQPQEGCYLSYSDPKIIFNRFLNRPTFALDAEGFFHTDSCYSCGVTDDTALVAVLNSRICWWLLSHLATALQNGYLQIFIKFLEQLPIPDLRAADELTDVTRRLLRSASVNDEERVEVLVRQAYEVTHEEGRLIDEWFARRQLSGGETVDTEGEGDYGDE